jgi:hypothetical protein
MNQSSSAGVCPVNAAEQVKNFELASKVASVVTLFKAQFPDARADLTPWVNDDETRELVDPESIDLCFHFPGWSRSLQSRSILVQIRFHPDLETGDRRAVGIEVIGFDYRGKAWQLSTITQWQFEGDTSPKPERQQQIKNFCRQVFELFNGEMF